jgi:putative alpha-1,2-mannosidase
MKKLLLVALLAFPVIASAQVNKTNLADLVNPLMGTDSKPSLSNGNTYPAIAAALGYEFLDPQTGKMGSGWQYTYNADKISWL